MSSSDTTLSTILWSLQTPEIADKLIELVGNLPLRAKKEGQNYILSTRAGTTKPPFPGRPTRSQGELIHPHHQFGTFAYDDLAGYNVVTIVEFKSVTDAEYWAFTDPLHKEMVALIDEPKFKDTIVTLFTNSDKSYLRPEAVGA